MSNFTLLYPSRTLAGVLDPATNLAEGASLGELRRRAAARIRELLEARGLSRLGTSDGEPDRWYWAAPLLLDQADEEFRRSTAEWFAGHKEQEADNETSQPDDQRGAKEEHFQLFLQSFEEPETIGLGRMPEDLPDILADLVLGSPAVLVYRTLKRLFPQLPASARMHHAHRVADVFAALFNKPESIAAVRLSETHAWYWQMVADYCGSGCLQAVLDEYFHLLAGQNVDPAGAVEQLLGAINLNASVINVDSCETFLHGSPRKLRCHYAVEFGSQRVETEKGQNRATSLREVFNSPFRPFVLSTTSIGQEGLDFHGYCRRVVHWNLPSNPVDLEQREGRVNRYKSLVIRQNIAAKYRHALVQARPAEGDDPWRTLFEIADCEERARTGKSELVPCWHIDTPDAAKIERVIPLYPFSIDHGRLQRLLKTLAIYRLAFGQPRQAELVNHLLDHNLSDEELRAVNRALMINLCPLANSR
jgi:hypothetical protein